MAIQMNLRIFSPNLSQKSLSRLPNHQKAMVVMQKDQTLIQQNPYKKKRMMKLKNPRS